MSHVLERVQALAERGELRVSLHGYEELAADGIRVRDVVEGLGVAVVIEEYADYAKGPCVGQDSPAVLVTAYRPDPSRWDVTWRRRRR